MFCRISSVQGEPERVDDGLRYVREEVQPQIDQLAGSLGLSAWVDRPSGVVSVATLWVDRAALEASAGAATELRQDTAKHLGGDATVEVFESAFVHQPVMPEPGSWDRSTRFDVATGDIDRLVEHFEHTSLPDMRQHDGLLAAVLLVDRTGGKALVALEFSSREEMEASRAASEQRRDSAMRDISSLAVTSVRESELVIADFRLPE